MVGEDGREAFIPADSVVLAAGMKAREAERDAFLGVAYDVIPVGDCVKAGTIRDATVRGFDAALRL